jgi:very-short-patch-repair endonuclease
MTLPEILLWQELRGGRLNGLGFRRQHPVGPYILDFFCPSSRLAVEVDGKVHEHPVQIQHDQQREQWLAEKGITVLRIGAADILRDGNMEAVLAHIEQVARPLHRFAVPLPRKRGRSSERTGPHTPLELDPHGPASAGGRHVSEATTPDRDSSR